MPDNHFEKARTRLTMPDKTRIVRHCQPLSLNRTKTALIRTQPHIAAVALLPLRTFASEHLKRNTAMKTVLKWTLRALKFVFTNESFRNFIASLLGKSGDKKTGNK